LDQSALVKRPTSGQFLDLAEEFLLLYEAAKLASVTFKKSEACGSFFGDEERDAFLSLCEAIDKIEKLQMERGQ